MRIRIWVLVSILVLGVYWLASWILSLPRTSAEYRDELEAVTVADGDRLFWGMGRCHVCHRIGERGYALRGPNLGESKDGKVIGARAGERARQLRLGNDADYLIQSLIDPGIFVVPGFKNEMPKISAPPISLSRAEIKAVALYLQSLGGTPDITRIRLPANAFASHDRSHRSAVINFAGDVESGRSLFFDAENGAGCASCHVGINANGEPEGSTPGPDLTAIAAYRTPEHIYWKIIRPDSNVVSGYEAVLIETKRGRLLVGVKQAEDEQKLALITKTREQIVLDKKNITKVTTQIASQMPGNYADLLTENQLADLLAYLLTLEGKEILKK
ncbi:MAG TPA: c-type cytochrome [bacterium]